MPTISKIQSDPLRGTQLITVGVRIIVWDHTNNKAFFVGKITSINGLRAMGENFVHTKRDGNLTVRTNLDFRDCGLIPINGTKNRYNPRFCTYLLPWEVDPLQYKYFQVKHRTPEQILKSKKKPKPKTWEVTARVTTR